MTADLVLLGGRVHTGLPSPSGPVEAVACLHGRIISIGSSAEIRSLVGPRTQVLNLNGRTVLPGFNDAHCHVLHFGTNLMQLDCRPERCADIGELATAVAEQAAHRPPGNWIQGWGYDDTCLRERRHPNRWDLDRAAPDHPVYITRTCTHLCAVNSKALELAGISRDTPDPPGGQIDRDPATGEPTGVLRETAMGLVRRVIPAYTEAELATAAALAAEVFVRQGLTSVTDAGAGYLTEQAGVEVRAYRQAMAAGHFPVRLQVMVMHQFLESLEHVGVGTGFGDEWLRIGPIKLFADGGFGGRTARLRQPYAGETGCGILTMDPDQLRERVWLAHRAGYQVAIHAIGDAAIDVVLDAYADALRRLPRANHRHRVEHAGLCDQDIVGRIRKLGLVAVPQPAFIYYLGDSWVGNLGPERAARTHPVGELLAAGIPTAGSSDRPVVDGHPLRGIWSAVRRQTRSGRIVGPEQAVDVSAAIGLYTSGAAFAGFQETEQGTLEPGKRADLVVLGADPLTVPVDEIPSIPVQMTIIGGRVVYTDSE